MSLLQADLKEQGLGFNAVLLSAYHLFIFPPFSHHPFQWSESPTRAFIITFKETESSVGLL